MTDKVQKVRNEVEKLKAQLIRGACSSQIAMETHCKEEAYNEVLAILNSLQEEPVCEELEEAATDFAEGEWEGIHDNDGNPLYDQDYVEYAFKAGAKWQKKHLWKPAHGNELPEYEREVIAILDYDFGHYKVVFAHRPNPEGWDAKSIITEKVEHYTPDTYDKGGWNIPDVKYWLDCYLPKEIEL